MEEEVTRRFTPAEVPELLGLCAAAGWNQTEADWLRLISLEPDGCFSIVTEGRIVATATAVCYGSELAWIGMVLTHPELRGRGLGSRVTARAIEHARSRGVHTVKLDATDMGRPVYVRLGFADECPIERWSRGDSAGRAAPLPSTAASPALPFDPTLNASLDRAAFGACRGELLSALAREGYVSAGTQGFCAARAGARSLQLGPCVARSPEAARDLVSAILASHPGESVFWDLLPGNTEAARLASALGFSPTRRLSRMVLADPAGGTPFRHDDSLVFATAGFEYG